MRACNLCFVPASDLYNALETIKKINKNIITITMKKLMMLALVLTTIAGTAFSRNPTEINAKILKTFSSNFLNAENVSWEAKKDFYKATFTISGQTMFAYYNEEGNQIAVTRNLLLSQLPLTLSTSLQKDFKQYWLTDLFEVSANGETAYYATVQDVKHIVVLKADGTTAWRVFKKDKK
jgi:hypothetical protein